jgi:hypothetical protein
MERPKESLKEELTEEKEAEQLLSKIKNILTNE